MYVLLVILDMKLIVIKIVQDNVLVIAGKVIVGVYQVITRVTTVMIVLAYQMEIIGKVIVDV